MKRMIPNLVTSLNLAFGLIGMILAYHGNMFYAAIAILLAGIADGNDGRVARYFKVSGDFGKELDSLCDVVSFGVAPAFIAYIYMLKDFGYIGYAVAIIYAVCGAMRLARFNVNTTVVKGFFMGMPIPAGGCLIATFVMTGMKPGWYWFPIMVLFFGYLLVSTVHYPEFKGHVGDKMNLIPKLISLAVGLGIIYIEHTAVLFAFFFAFAVFGILNTLYNNFIVKA